MRSEHDNATRQPGLWNRVDGLIDTAPSLHDLQAHGLHLLAARRRRALGQTVPPGLARDELRAAFALHAVPGLLAEVRAACEGPILLIKGPAAAERYPQPELRPFVDLDLVVPDAEQTQAELVAAGFVPTGDAAFYAGVEHHLQPLRSPRFPIDIEIHDRPKWVAALDPPAFGELVAGAAPAAFGVDGILDPAPARHALVLAAHLWSHEPFTRLLRLLDVVLTAQAADPKEVESVARAWKLSRLWGSTVAVTNAVLDDQPEPWLLRLAGRGLSSAREATVLEVQLARLLAPLSIHPADRVPAAVWKALAQSLRPGPGESWSGKARRTARQLTRPSTSHSENLRSIESPRDRT